MKRLIAILVFFAAAVCSAQVQQANDIYIVNTNNQVKLTGLSPNQTLPWVEFGSRTNTAFQVTGPGAIVLGSTTNHITFGATNPAPATTNTPIKWISVRISGDSTNYVLPLYK